MSKKKIIIISIIVILFIISIIIFSDGKKSNDKNSNVKKTANKQVIETDRPTTETYTCRLHPQIRFDHPGKCPKCGNTLEKEDE